MPKPSSFRIRFALVAIGSVLALGFLMSSSSAQPGRPPGGFGNGGGIGGRPPGGIGGMPGGGIGGMPDRPPGGIAGMPGGAGIGGAGISGIGGMPGPGMPGMPGMPG